MSDRLDNSPATGANGGWFVPKDGLTEQEMQQRRASALTSAQVPFPIDAEPARVGGWYVPRDATERVSSIILGRQLVTAEEDTEEALETAPKAEEKPEQAAQPTRIRDLPPGAALATEADYSNYVPGVGFVTPGEAATMTPPADDKPVTPEPKPAAHIPEPHHAPGSTPQAPPSPISAMQAQPTAVEDKPMSKTSEGDLSRKFYQVEQSVQVLRRRYTAGALTRDQLKEELRRLMILDDDGNWWMIGLESDRWYKYNGTEWVLANPPGYQPKAEPVPTPAATGTPSGSLASRFNVPLDEHGMPLPQKVSVEDEGATIVGRWASRLGSESESIGVGTTVPSRAVDAGLTVPSKAVDPNALTQPSAAVSGQTMPAGQRAGWERRLASSSAAGSGGVAAPSPRLGVGAVGTIPAGIQPDYGLRPTGLMADRQRYGGCIIQLALAAAFLVLGFTCLAAGGATLFYFSTIGRYENRIANLGNVVQGESQSVRIFDAENRQIFQLNDPNLGARLQVPLRDVSPYMIYATIATENERFYSDPGFDVIALVRAILQNLRAGEGVSGASTLTQQIARAYVLDPGAASDRTVGRKIDEIIASSEIARRYSKNQILEFYLNSFYYGNLAYGVEAAAQTYFRKKAKDLNLAESAFLAGLVQAPAAYDPAINPNGALQRAEIVRGLMLRLGCIQMEHEPYNTAPFCVTQDDMNAAVVQIAQVVDQMTQFRPQRQQVTYPHFVQYVREQLEAQFGQEALYRSGFNVYTTIDRRVQDLAQQAVQSQIAALQAQNVRNGAVIALRPSDGAILAMVGSVNFYDNNIDGQVNVVRAPRQPGSSMKPFIYLAAMERDQQNRYWTPATIIWDVESCFGSSAAPYCPRNYDNRFHGPQSLRSSLANSYNIPAVKALAFAGMDHFKDVAARFGINFPLQPPEQAGLSLALGGAEVTLFDLTQAYMTLANGGNRIPTYAISKITRTRDGREETVFQYQPAPPQTVAEPGLTYLLTSILSDNGARTPAFGANSPLVLRNGHIAAAKTGTTNDNKDNWTIGYTPDLVVGVWVGNTRGEPMRGVSGITGAAPIWNAIMTNALPALGAQPKQFPVPPNIQQVTVCSDFGTLDFAECLNRRAELYFAPNPPPDPRTIIQTLDVDTFSGLIANENCPDFVERKTYLNIDDPTAIAWLNNTPAGQQWAQERNIPLPLQPLPTGSCPVGAPRPVLQITNPSAGQQIAGLVQIDGTVFLPGFNRYQIEVASGHPPQSGFGIVDGPITAQPNGQGVFLGRWDTTRYPNGPYTLKLWAVDGQGRYVQRTIPVTVANGIVLPGTVPGVEPTPQPPIIINPGEPTPQPPIIIDPGGPTPQPPIIIDPGGPTPQPPISIFPPTNTPQP